MKKILYIDMDGVIVDFGSAIPRLDPELRERFEKDKDEIPGIFSLMDPMPGAIESVEFLAKHFDLYILSTSPWNNPTAASGKVLWVRKYLPEVAYKRLILSHHKNLNKGDYIIDDRTARGVDKFEGEHIHFGQVGFENWEKVVAYLVEKEGIHELEESHRKVGRSMEELIQNRIENFWGYGNLESDIWFLSMEEGTGGILDELRVRFDKTWNRSVLDCYDDMLDVPEHIKFYSGTNPPLQSTMSKIIRVLLNIKTEYVVEKEKVRAFQRDHFGRLDSDHCSLEFMPLPVPSTDTWIYQTVDLPYLESRGQYNLTIMKKRIELFRNMVKKYNPGIVVFYSLQYFEQWKDIIGGNPEKIGENIWHYRKDNTHFFIIPHPQMFGLNNDDWDRFGKLIKNKSSNEAENITEKEQEKIVKRPVETITKKIVRLQDDNRLKDFFRFKHDDVLEDLVILMDTLDHIGDYNFGSSGEGELTIKGDNGTVYARKFKKKEEWKVVYCPRPGSNFTNYESSIDMIIEQMRKVNL